MVRKTQVWGNKSGQRKMMDWERLVMALYSKHAGWKKAKLLLYCHLLKFRFVVFCYYPFLRSSFLSHWLFWQIQIIWTTFLFHFALPELGLLVIFNLLLPSGQNDPRGLSLNCVLPHLSLVGYFHLRTAGRFEKRIFLVVFQPSCL